MSLYPVKLEIAGILTLALASFAVVGQQPQPQSSSSQDQTQPQGQQPPHVDQQTNPQARELEKNITAALNQDPHMAYSRVTVHATDKEVVLSGVVLTSEAKDQAERIAAQQSGGKKIKNKIRVNPNIHPGPGL